jgi:hypothetical protein
MADPVGGFLLGIAIAGGIRLIQAALQPKQEIEGPRLDDTSIASSAYGKNIPLAYGTDIIGGNVIWGKDIIEVANVYDIPKGKGNPFSLGTQTEYEYFLTCAVGIAQREAFKLIGIYADGKLIYDAQAVDLKSEDRLHPFLDSVPEEQRVDDLGNEKAPPIIRNLEFNFYRGTQDQDRDPIIAADVGEDVCPAHRGLCYVVFNRMPLKDFANRVPQFRFVVAWGQTSETGLVFRRIGSTDPVNPDTANYPWVYDRGRQIVYSIKYGQNGVFWQEPGYYLEAASAQTGEQLAFNFNIDQDALSAISFLVGAQTNYLAARSPSDLSGFHTPIVFFDKELLVPVGRTGTNEEIQELVDPLGTGLPIIQSGWTVPTVAAVNFGAGMQPVEMLTIYGFRAFLIGGPPFNSYGGGHVHSIAVVSMNLSDLGSVVWHENGCETTNPNAVDEWRYGLYPGPDECVFFGTLPTEAGDGEINYGYGFVGAWQGRNITFGQIEVIIATGLDPDADDEGFMLHLCEMDSGGQLKHTGIRWLVTEFGSPTSGGANRPDASYVEESNRLVFLKGDLWVAYDLDRDAIAANGGVPPIAWTRTDLLGIGRTIDTWHLRPDGNRLMSRDSDTQSSAGIFQVVDVDDGSTIKTYTAPTFTLGDGLSGNYIPNMYEPGQDRGLVIRELSASNIVFGFQYFEPGLDRPGEPLDVVVSDIVTRGKLTESDIDVSDLATKSVRGYVIARDTTFRRAIEPLQRAYNFIGIEKDGKIVFKFKDGETDVVIPEDDLVRSSRRSVFEEERKDEVTVPRSVFVNYRSTLLKDETSTQHARQTTDTFLTVGAEGETKIELPLVMSDQEAKDLAERTLFESRLSLDNFQFTLPAQYLRIIPGDVLQVTAAGRVETILATEVSVGFDLEVQIEGTLVDGDIYTANVEAAIPYGSPNFSSGGVAPTPARSVVGFLMDLPPLRYDMVSSISRTSGTYMGFAAGLPPVYSRSRFVGGALQLSYTGGSDFATRSVTSDGMAYGIVRGSIPAMPSANFNGVQDGPDDYITMGVGAGADQFVSVTRAQMIGEQANPAILYSPSANILEVIRYQTVTEVETPEGTSEFRLSNLMRGQRGTNTEALRWATEDAGVIYVIIPTEATLRVFTEPLSRQGDTVIYRTLPIGTDDPTTFRTTELTYLLRGLLPFSPANVKLTFDDPSGGEYEIRWNRRTRGEGAWRNQTGAVELEEDEERFEVDILSGTGGTVLRTLETTSESVLYTADQIDADFGSSGLPEPLYVRVYQISGQVGRGYSFEAALTVEE